MEAGDGLAPKDVAPRDQAADLGSDAEVKVSEDTWDEIIEDKVPPIVELVLPEDGASVTGKVAVQVDASDGNGIDRVELYLDDQELEVLSSAPFEYEWDTAGLAAGTYTILAVAFDRAGNRGEDQAMVNLLTGCDDLPNVVITAPVADSFVLGAVDVVAEASDGTGLGPVQFFVDDSKIADLSVGPFTAQWNTADSAEGSHSLKVVAYDKCNQKAEHQIQVTVDRTEPILNILGPVPTKPHDKTARLDFEVTDNFVVRKVVVSGAVGPFTMLESPFVVDIDSSGFEAGDWDYTVSAEDGAGNITSKSSSFLVDRAPVVSITQPSDGAKLTGETEIRLSASDDLSRDLVVLKIDGQQVKTHSGGSSLPSPFFVWQPPYQKASHEILAVVFDGSGQESSASITVFVDYPVTVELADCSTGTCKPLAPNTTLTGLVLLEAEAEDDGADIKQVQLLVDGNLVQAATISPFSFAWDSTTVSDGVHTLKVVASNTLDETGEAQVSVKVNNCDVDGDGYLAEACEGTDCNDADKLVHPPAVDTVGDSKDQNCDGLDGVDADGDGYASKDSAGEDCDDSKALIHPCAADLPGDSLDANCDGKLDGSCDDCDPCTTDSLVNQSCTHVSIPEDGACEDGDPCTVGETCTKSKCDGGVFSDGLACPDGVCFFGVCCYINCIGRVCGYNGCGGSCGICGAGKKCSPYGTCVVDFDALGNEWKSIPGGTFQMGCSPGDAECKGDENPAHQVTLSDFEMLETEVTEGQYLAVIGSNPSAHYNGANGADMPVENLTRSQAKAFCQAVGGRLPTEAEWEYAARGKTTTKYYCGYDDSCLGGIAWYSDNSSSQKHPVKWKTPNAYGLYDILGNVSEWTNDFYGGYSADPQTNPQGPVSGSDRVARGGTFVNYGAGVFFLRVSDRGRVNLDYFSSAIGFRCARSK